MSIARTCTARSAFTLIELVVVMGLMMLMMAAGVAGYRGMRRGAELRGGESAVRTTLMLARQQAITRRQNVEINFVQEGPVNFTTNSMRIFSGGSMAHTEVFLPAAVEFVAPPAPIVFKPAGGAVTMPEVLIKIREKAGMGDELGSVTITVWPLTGVTK